MNILLYDHDGSGNHGCEAIVRGMYAILKSANMCDELFLLSLNPAEDTKYLNNIPVKVKEGMPKGTKADIKFLSAYARLKLQHDQFAIDKYRIDLAAEAFSNIDLAISIGGDIYCYGHNEMHFYRNQKYISKNIPVLLYGCSIEPSAIDRIMEREIEKLSLVVSRESITYGALNKFNKNTLLAPDPAFFMEPQECSLDERFLDHRVIGINISPMIISNEKSKGLTYANYKHLIQWILENTEDYIALIPHVIWKSNDDRIVLRQLYEELDQNKRLILIEDHCAPELKYIISKCSLFVGARTHATIAAYSTGVPTLVVGYSVKARGIAVDLFGTTDGYVLPVQSLENENDLLLSYQRLAEREEEDHRCLIEVVPKLKKQITNVLETVGKLM